MSVYRRTGPCVRYINFHGGGTGFAFPTSERFVIFERDAHSAGCFAFDVPMLMDLNPRTVSSACGRLLLDLCH